jgi:hypothetical protein
MWGAWIMGQLYLRFWGGIAFALLCATLMRSAAFAADPSVNELKARLSSSSIRERTHLCLHIAEMQMAAADKLYAADEMAQAQSALSDVVSYSELARDYAIQSRKYQKQTEIAVRGMARRLGELAHALPHDYQAPLHDALNKLQHVRDDLLSAMFPQGGNGK